MQEMTTILSLKCSLFSHVHVIYATLQMTTMKSRRRESTGNVNYGIAYNKVMEDAQKRGNLRLLYARTYKTKSKVTPGCHFEVKYIPRR